MTEGLETGFEADVWQGFKVFFQHPKRLIGSAKEVDEEFEEAWNVISRCWPTHIAKVNTYGKKYNQLKVLSDFAVKNVEEFPNICLLIQFMMATLHDVK